MTARALLPGWPVGTFARGVGLVLVLTGALTTLQASAGVLVTNEFGQSVGLAFEEGMGAFGVQLNQAGDAVVLYDTVLIEDDGPGLKTSSKWVENPDGHAPLQGIKGEVQLKKILFLTHPEAFEARLFGARGLMVRCNGHEVPADPRTVAPHVPPAFLRKGDNEFVLSSPVEREISLARRQDIVANDPAYGTRPGRSFRSSDGGRNWEAVDGEYRLRLQLSQYITTGSLLSPVLDLGKQGGEDLIFPPAIKVRAVSLLTECETPQGTGIEFCIRTGTCPVFDAGAWSGWNTDFDQIPSGHRYLQWRAVLRTTNPLATPELKSITVRATVEVEPTPVWAGGLKVMAATNPMIRYTSIPFEYEDPLNPRLVALRQKYQLDEVVAAGRNELEKLILLKAWVGRSLHYQPPTREYPAWDADEILSRKAGFCVQYAVTFVQCAASLGYQARYCFANNEGANRSTGHEFAEVWSDDFGKWVFMDPNNQVHHVDRQSRAPMSLLDLHNLLLKTYYGDRVASWTNGPKTMKTSASIATCYGSEFSPVKPNPRKGDAGGEGDLYYVPPRWLYLRYLPRNNFYSKPHPLPQSQGFTWDWPDYWFFLDAQTPKVDWAHRYFTRRVADLSWTLNQVRFATSCADSAGLVNVVMGTVTPFFETYLCRTDQGAWTPSDRQFQWKLHPGENRLEMRVRNNAGVLGPVSSLTLTYANRG